MTHAKKRVATRLTRSHSTHKKASSRGYLFSNDFAEFQTSPIMLRGVVADHDDDDDHSDAAKLNEERLVALRRARAQPPF